MIAKVYTFTIIGIEAYPVEVEVDISLGLPQLNIVGLPDSVVKESKERIRSAVRNSGYKFPDRRITVNLAPAQIKKEGSGFDLPIAIGILAASGVISHLPEDSLFCVGELSLDGCVKPVNGILSMALRARKEKVKLMMVPVHNAAEAALVGSVPVYPLKTLGEAVMFLTGHKTMEPFTAVTEKIFCPVWPKLHDFSEVKGQKHVKRALEVAVSGGHNILLVGPPGSGKTMLAERLPTILPPLTFEEALETSQIYSVAGLLKESSLMNFRPFRSPHHTISYAGLVGGGTVPKPGEISLAHNGVLFLDEFPEFKKHTIEMLRQPMEDGKVTISRANISMTYPARFMLVAAMNPCPCGYLGSSQKSCTCSSQQVAHYRSRLSGPILDRIDIQIELPPVKYENLINPLAGEESSESIRNRVIKARQVQFERYRDQYFYCNASMEPSHIDTFCRLDKTSQELIKEAIRQLGLSARAYHRILKVARTIADLEDSRDIKEHHLLEAVQYRPFDRA